MRASRLAVVSMAALWTIACAHGFELRSSDTPGAPPSTYFVLEGNSSGIPTVDRELKAQIEMALADRGMLEVAPWEAEAVVIVHIATPAKPSRQALYEGWGGWEWRVGGTGTPDGNEIYKAGTLVVDVFDAWTKKLIWHGSATNAVSSRSNSTSSNNHAVKDAVIRVVRKLRSGGDQMAQRDVNAPFSTTPGDQRMNIIFSPAPALLLRIDGEPQFEDIAGTRLQRVVNTAALIIRDEYDIYYLRLGDSWLQAYELTGSWSVTELPPDGADLAIRQAARERGIDPLASIRAHGPMPVVFVSTTPADLIVTDGDPEFVPLDGTALLQVRNTTGSVFREPTDQELYVHVSSGWFRAWTMAGPWQRVPENELPADLSRI